MLFPVLLLINSGLWGPRILSVGPSDRLFLQFCFAVQFCRLFCSSPGCRVVSVSKGSPPQPTIDCVHPPEWNLFPPEQMPRPGLSVEDSQSLYFVILYFLCNCCIVVFSHLQFLLHTPPFEEGESLFELPLPRFLPFPYTLRFWGVFPCLPRELWAGSGTSCCGL